MIGNAAEWVEDCLHKNYEGAPVDGSAWIAQSDCTSRAVRGGSYYNIGVGLRSAKRYFNSASSRVDTVGFRVARPIRR
jgi:formylglycine-generating enzyme required for sulfatase activity